MTNTERRRLRLCTPAVFTAPRHAADEQRKRHRGRETQGPPTNDRP
eukprot:CAMPEP_0119524390 /NCGR_PEP_ID=MMETSP1344-20130328/39336_1 /TAXON_ID=236787 /ORGANISM="Florenciella parvula, Strain CCMP2471" /LENGTH=45 /DNA_ID= /DNA_START= /DNA_END= /DNA_ORIENTATION=